METKRYAASGGIIIRNGEALLLHKHKKDEYVLPKGHVEVGETLEEAALREAREETGFANLRLLANLGTLQSQYEYRGYWVERDETYFVMQLLDEAGTNRATTRMPSTTGTHSICSGCRCRRPPAA